MDIPVISKSHYSKFFPSVSWDHLSDWMIILCTLRKQKGHEFAGYWPVLLLNIPRLRNQSNLTKSTTHMCCVYY